MPTARGYYSSPRCLSPWQTHKIRRCFFFCFFFLQHRKPRYSLCLWLQQLSLSSAFLACLRQHKQLHCGPLPARRPSILPPSPSGHPPTDVTPASLATCQRPVSRSVTSAHQSVNLAVRGESACSPVGRSASQSIKRTACHWGDPSARRANSQPRDVHQRSTVPSLSPDRYPGWLFPSSATEQKSRFSSS